MCNDPGMGNSPWDPPKERPKRMERIRRQSPKRVQYLYAFRSAFAVPQLDRIEAAQAEEFAGGECSQPSFHLMRWAVASDPGWFRGLIIVCSVHRFLLRWIGSAGEWRTGGLTAGRQLPKRLGGAAPCRTTARWHGSCAGWGMVRGWMVFAEY